MSGYLIFNGTDSREFGVEIFFNAIDSAPARRYSVNDVPGKSGSIILDEKRYPNTALVYDAICYSERSFRQFRAFLLSQVGYKRLEDSFHTDEFYHAYYSTDIMPSTVKDRGLFKFRVEFTRKPQRFLKSGETAISLSASGTVQNEQAFASRPIIRIYGTGTVGVGSYAVKVNACDVYTDVDCEIMECYKGLTSCNTLVELQNNTFPVLEPGSNGVTLGTGITKVEITPKWFRL